MYVVQTEISSKALLDKVDKLNVKAAFHILEETKQSNGAAVNR